MYRLINNGIEYVLENRKLLDLNPIFFGKENCLPGKKFGPTIRPYTLVHYVQEGKGTVTKEYGEIPVHAGQAFIIHPGEVVTYTADTLNPWHYYWVAFDGQLAERFKELDDVVDMSNDIFERIYECGNSDMREYRIVALLYEMYIFLFSKNEVRNDYIKQVKDYVKALYMSEITVGSVARAINLDRRYLSRIFKQKAGMTIQDYIINTRIKAAQKNLLQGCSVIDAALISGYVDVSNFSKMFKRRTGVSPAQWKKNNLKS